MVEGLFGLRVEGAKAVDVEVVWVEGALNFGN